jgi:hypothetical protein
MYIKLEDESSELSTNETSHLFSATFKRDQPLQILFSVLVLIHYHMTNQIKQLLRTCIPVLQETSGVIA